MRIVTEVQQVQAATADQWAYDSRVEDGDQRDEVPNLRRPGQADRVTPEPALSVSLADARTRVFAEASWLPVVCVASGI